MVLKQCGLILTQCGPEGRVILSECGSEMGDVFGPGDLCSKAGLTSDDMDFSSGEGRLIEERNGPWERKGPE